MRIVCVLLFSSSLAAAEVCPSTPVTCTDASLVNPVYILSGDTQVPVIHSVGKLLRAQASPTTLVYIPNGSCTNLTNLYTNKFTAGAGGGPYYIPADPAFDVTVKTACPCTLATPITPDVANSIVFPDAKSCPTTPVRPSGIGQFQGPVQGMVFVVPYDTVTHAGSSQLAITAEEAYLVMGLGPTDAMVPPWNQPAYLFGRPASKGTQVSIGENIGVPAAKWKLLADAQHTIDQSSDLASAIAALANDPNAEQALGILGTEVYDKAANRKKMHSLAFRAYQQLRAYWPDSTASAFDKRNVRDGHYALWSYVQYLAPVDVGGVASKPGVKLLIDAMLGNATGLTATTTQSADPIDGVMQSGLVPNCAMGVQRSVEGGPLSRYDDAAPCACYFEKMLTASTACAACGTGNPCASGMCRRGLCEVR